MVNFLLKYDYENQAVFMKDKLIANLIQDKIMQSAVG